MEKMNFSEDFVKESLYVCLVITGLMFLGLVLGLNQVLKMSPNIILTNLTYWLIILAIFITVITISIGITWKIEKLMIMTWLLNIEDKDWQIFHWTQYLKSGKSNFDDLLILLQKEQLDYCFLKAFFNTHVLIVSVDAYEDVKTLTQLTFQ